VIRRREFLLTPLALAAQSRPPDVLLSKCVVFPRAYTCCPQPEFAVRALETSKFPHAIEPGDPAVIRFSSLTHTEAGNIAVFTAAYGDGANSPLEASVKIPLAIWAPGLLMPRTADEILISTVDIAPTLLGLRGEAVPEGLQGRDLSGLLLGKTHELPDSVYIEGGIGPAIEWRAVIRGFDKLVMDLNGNVTHLYNLASDPTETTNLVLDSSTQLTRDALVALARTWMRRTGDHTDPSGLKRR
jgi:arylsulfatase A-like enzyme